ncbi:MAG: glycosyltransferase family 4 protein [bacterium]
MFRILYLVSTLEKCGPTKQLFYILKYLDKKKIEPFVLTLSPEPINSMWEDFKKLNISIDSLNRGRISGLFFAKNEVKKFIDENSIDLIHSHFIRADEIASDTEIKNITTIRYNPDFIDRKGARVLLVKFLAYIHYKAMKKFDKVVTCSESLNSYFRKKKSLFFKNISNSVDLENAKFLNLEKRKEFKRKLIGNDEKKVFMTVDSAILGKNVETAIKSFLKVSNQNNILIVAGESLLKEKYNNSQIIFVGNVDNFYDYLYASDFFISASLSEGMPNAVLEAMATGLPVILSDIPPHREIVEGTVFENYLFEPKNVEELKEKITKITKENYESLSVASRKIMEDSFDAKKMAEKYESEYFSLLKND